MSEPDDPRDELMNGLLGRGGRSSPSDRLRGAVFAKTLGVIRFRRRLKKCALAAALVGCYLAGMATTGAWQRAGDGRPQPSTQEVAANQSTGKQEPPSPRGSSPLPEPAGASDRHVPAEKLSRAEILRRNADQELFENGDVKSAMRAYQRLLKISSAEQRAISPKQDNWLLMALKDARSKEMKHDRIEQD